MRLEAVTVCVNYADFLAESAKYNAGMFDRWIVVTEEGDTETRQVCRKYNLQTLLTKDGKRDGATFAKGRMIERGLRMLSADAWRIHLDADMVLPARFRNLLTLAEPETQKIYGIDRVMIHGWDEWKKFLASGHLWDDAWGWHYRMAWPSGIQPGSRWVGADVGYCPVGAFQLWHSDADEWNGIRVRPYPANHGDACRTDIQHGLQWDRPDRVLIPEIIGIHLSSEPCQLGKNWNGRKTKRFGPGAHERPKASY